MKTGKVMRRLARVGECPELLNTVARDAGVALARGERDALRLMVRELAARAPGGDGDPPRDRDAQDQYWAGFSAAMGMVLASYEAEHGNSDARVAAMRAVSRPAARRVLCELAHGPATGAALAGRLQLTRGGVSKILKSLRGVGLARLAGGGSDAVVPERGAPKPHVLTAQGAALAGELVAEREREHAHEHGHEHGLRTARAALP
jgi:DNA-binding transcriptional ArsR family regulator